MANPTTLLVQPIANNGTKNLIPNTTQTPGLMSQDKGFPPECSQPLNAGGYAPMRQDINGALYLLSSYAMMYQRGGVWQYDASQNYEVPAFIQDAEDGGYYFCAAANGPALGNTTSPHEDDGTYWTPMIRVIINSIYPVGSIYLSVIDTSPAILFGGTWEKIQGKFLLGSSMAHSLGSTGGDENLQIHNHGITINSTSTTHNHSGGGTATNNGAHTHTRGTMNITGQVISREGCDEGPFPSAVVASGAFYAWRQDGKNGADGETPTGAWAFNFDASRSWNGATSSNGSHTHNVSVSVNNTTQSHTHTGSSVNAGTGTGGNMPPFLTVNIWKRTA